MNEGMDATKTLSARASGRGAADAVSQERMCDRQIVQRLCSGKECVSRSLPLARRKSE